MDHPTEVVWVTYLKLKRLLYELVAMQCLVRVIAYVSTIKFQKRGLPHIHVMLTLEESDRPTTPEEINLLVSAEIPDPTVKPLLHEIVTD
jgi:hypothetical protein